jgi:hypothetical protein
MSCADCTASWAFNVNLSKRTILFLPRIRKTEGPFREPAPTYDIAISRPSGYWKTYFPLLAPVTVTFTWRGLVSSRFGNVTVNTPSLYSATIASAFSVLGSEKLRLNEP